MSLWDKKTPESEGDAERKSLLFNLWHRSGAKNSPDEQPAEEPENAAPPEVPYEKTAAPEELVQYHMRWRQNDNWTPHETLLIEDFCADPLPDTGYLKQFFAQIKVRVQAAMKNYDRLMKMNLELAEEYLASVEKEKLGSEAPEGHDGLVDVMASPPLDGDVMLFCAPDWSAAWCVVFPPLGGGAAVSGEDIRKLLEQKSVSFGIDEEKLAGLASGEHCFILTQIACGVQPVRGEDGSVFDHFPRTIGTPHFVENEQGIIDFENLNWLVPIEEGSVICDIIPPTEGKPGIDVRGRQVKAYNGRKPTLPMGENVVLNPEGTSLVAKISGQILFRNGKFQVNNVIVIPGNVDLSTGSLNVRGDLTIHGNVQAGFTVQATGDVTIGGIVEGAQVSAGGSIIVNRGMNGNLVGRLMAGKDIYCKYMENASVHAEGDIHMDSIVNSEVSCNGKLIVQTGRGVIIGGTVLAMGGIEAKIVGNKAGRLTVLSVGTTKQFEQEKDQVRRELDTIQYELRKQQATGEHGPAALNAKVLQMKEGVLQKKMEQFEEQEAAVRRGQIHVSKLYPIVQMSICGVSRAVVEPYATCRAYLDSKEGDIKIATI